MWAYVCIKGQEKILNPQSVKMSGAMLVKYEALNK